MIVCVGFSLSLLLLLLSLLLLLLGLLSLLLCWLLWHVVPQATLLGWLAMKYAVAVVRLGIAWRYRHDGPAHELLDEAMTVFEQLGAEDYVLDTRLRIAEWELLAGSPAAALVILDETSPAISRIGDPGILPVTEARLRGFVLLAADRAADARRAFRRAHTIASCDSFEFEMAMADLGLSACGDEFEHHRVGAEALLRHLGVEAPPPTAGPITPPGRSPG